MLTDFSCYLIDLGFRRLKIIMVRPPWGWRKRSVCSPKKGGKISSRVEGGQEKVNWMFCRSNEFRQFPFIQTSLQLSCSRDNRKRKESNLRKLEEEVILIFFLVHFWSFFCQLKYFTGESWGPGKKAGVEQQGLCHAGEGRNLTQPLQIKFHLIEQSQLPWSLVAARFKDSH